MGTKRESPARVQWFTRYGWEGASARYRALQYVERLDLKDFRSDVESLARWGARPHEQLAGVVRRARHLRTLNVDGLVIQKEAVSPPMFWPVVRPSVESCTSPIVWDIDDAVWIGRRGSATLAADLARRATVVVAGNQLLADWAVGSGARDVRIIPTCYEPLAPPAPRTGGDRVEVVWIGSPSTAEYLEVERERFEPLRRLPNVRVTFVGGRAPTSLRGLPNVRELAWSAAIEHEVLSSADYGLAMQPRTPYADHKCGLKVIQYMAYGVIPVATSNPVHDSIIGRAGLLVGPASRDVFAEQFTQKPTAEQRAAAAARWESAFSVAHGTQSWATLLDSII